MDILYAKKHWTATFLKTKVNPLHGGTMRKILLLSLFVFGVASFSIEAAHAQETTYRPQTFTAQVENVRLQSQLIQQGKKNEDKVSVEVPAILYAKPLHIADVRTASPGYGPEIDFLVAYTKANIEGTKEDILAFWYPNNRDRLQQVMSNSDLFAKNREMSARTPSLDILGFVQQKNSLAIIKQLRGKTAFGISLKKENNRLYLIDTPAEDDLELAIIEASLTRDDP